MADRKLPWWLAGTSMVATTFAVDKPLAITEFVYKYGIAGCALIYTMLFGIGKLLLKDFKPLIGFVLVGATACALIFWNMSRRGWMKDSS